MRVNAAEGMLNAMGLHAVGTLTKAHLQRAAEAPAPPATLPDPEPTTSETVVTRHSAEMQPLVPEAVFPDVVRTLPDTTAAQPVSTTAEPAASFADNWSLTVGFQYDSREADAGLSGTYGPSADMPTVNGWAIGAIGARPLSDDGSRFIFGYGTYRDQSSFEGNSGNIRYDRGLDLGAGYGQYVDPNTVISVSVGTDGFRTRLTQVF